MRVIKKKTLILQFFMVFFAISEIMDLSEQFYIWACMREFGFYELTVPGVIMFNLLGVVIGYPLLIAYVKSVCGDIYDAEIRGIDLMADGVIRMLLSKAEEEGAEDEL